MTHGYRIFQHFNQWLSQQYLGKCLFETEQQLLSSLLKRHYGRHALVLGVPRQLELLQSSAMPCHTLISPLVCHEENHHYIEADFRELPILTGSIDLVILPHTLELIDHPRHLLIEACRIVKPEGLIVIAGFNRLSSWGIKKIFSKGHHVPWSLNFLHLHEIKNWLRLAEFELEEQRTALFRPPIKNKMVYQKLMFMEKIGDICFKHTGGIYLLFARAKVIPLTPIKLKWKQQLSQIRLPTTRGGYIARHLEHSKKIK
ncbi:MAG: hypothetical protein A3F12_04675 [Gammaproteobacteria bacterium RIFCSPHIGHO2_12_FULL_38_14]|nr:MAG: hypothetical protein A3F12_04675 [Gammaproteobacteria bacterium RIFCSPHIGHO2_12_FULL_38_14]